MRRPLAAVLTIGLLFALICPTTVSAQATAKRLPIPKMKPLTLQAKDGMELQAYYFGSNKGKESVPVLIVHEWKGQSAPYSKLCQSLQKSGFSVLVLDYRGHGKSREYTDPSGRAKEFDLKTMNKRHVGDIVMKDLEAAKKFLKKENDEGKLNLNALVVIGSREGCVLAANWAQQDWRFPSVGSRKQGQDVKGLVMLSPKRLVKGVTIEKALSDPNISRLPMLFMVGRGSSEESDTKRIFKRVEAGKKKLSGKREPEGLDLVEIKAQVGGSDLLVAPEAIPAIIKFIGSEVPITDTENPWVERD